MTKKQQRVVRAGIVKMLVVQGVEHKHAWSEVGFMLNRCDREAVASAVIASVGSEYPLIAVRRRLDFEVEHA